MAELTDPEKITNLEKLVLSDSFKKLETLTSTFNIFESIGAVRRELRHSDFLAFLIDPSLSHGLSDMFVKALLMDFALKSNSSLLSPIYVDGYELEDLTVKREWKDIDILFLSEKEKVVCAIENKVDASESKGQLRKYYTTVLSEYPEDYKKIFVFLTVDERLPEEEDDQNIWLTYSYQSVYKLLNNILARSTGSIGNDVQVLIEHYKEMINRHLMENNEITKLCLEIYKNHRQALDLIYDKRPDIQSEIRDYCISELEKYQEHVSLDHSNKSLIRLAVKDWDVIPNQLSGQKQWTESSRVLLLEIVNKKREIFIQLILGPGEADFRQEVFNKFRINTLLKARKTKNLSDKFSQLYRLSIYSKDIDYESLDKITGQVSKTLKTFFSPEGDFHKLKQLVISMK
jgi:hypothetical protein